MSRHQCMVAAEAFAAGVFAQAGCSVFVQYGANQPGYDLLVERSGITRRVSVKGSSDLGWIVTMKGNGETYKQALDAWALKNAGTLFCYVQFGAVKIGEMPRLYLVESEELNQYLRTVWFGELMLSLWEAHAPSRGPNKGKEFRIPASWLVSQQRIEDLVTKTAPAPMTVVAAPSP